MKKENYKITGMSCSACSARVEKAVSALDGMNKASVNLLTGSMSAEYDEASLDSSKIIAAVEHAGYGAELPGEKTENTKREKPSDGYAELEKSLKHRFIVSLCFLVPLMFISMYHMLPWRPEFIESFMQYFHGTENAISFAFSQFLLLIPVMVVNRLYYIRGFKSLFHGAPNMDSLIAIGSAAATAYGIYAIFAIGFGLGHGNTELVSSLAHDVYFESAGTILTLITLGKWLEAKSKRKTGDSISKLVELAPDTAIVERSGTETEIASDDVAVGDIVIIKSGTRVPVDGCVINGEGSVDESAITGESIPVFKSSGEKVISATILNSGYLKIRAEHVKSDTTINKMIKLVEEASATKAPIARIADKISGIFVPTVIGIAVLAMIIWLICGASFQFALSIAISVLIISCPCALGLATPVAIMVGTGKGAENGMLIRSGEALETAHNINTVVCDKTGTITEGKPTVTDIITFEGDEKTLLANAAALEKLSEHPLAAAICERAGNSSDISVENFISHAGKGIEGVIDGKRWLAGNRSFLNENNINADSAEAAISRLSDEGKTAMLFSEDGKFSGIIAVSDPIKETSREAVEEFRKLGLDVVMLTGDNEQTAKAVAKQAGIENVIAGVLPAEKESKIRELQEKGQKVAMIGDGVNDAPALTRADVGIAIGAGTDIAIESADIVLIKNSLVDAAGAIKLSRAVIRNIKENLFWAFFYNAICIPLAAGVFFTAFGLKLNPMIGAAAMSLSSVCVVSNALRLKRFKTGNKTSNIKTIESERKEMSENTFTMKIEGMMCAHCKARVEKALAAVPGVISADVDLENKSAAVKAEPTVNAEALKSAVTEADYEVISIE